MTIKPKILELEDELGLLDFQPDAVAVDEQTLNRLLLSYQQEFEVPTVTTFDIESYLSTKIFLSENTKKEFEFFSNFKK